MNSGKKVNIPSDGFVKSVGTGQQKISGEQKAQLVRRGNELFNQGHYDLAERIFVTLQYTDGLVRVGDVYFKRQDYQHALRLYMQAPDQARVSKVTRRMAMVLRQWLIESAKTDSAIEAISSGRKP